MHEDALLFTRNQDILDIFSNGDQGACFYIVITVVFNKRFDCLSGKGKELHLIKDDQGTAFDKVNAGQELQLQEEVIEVRSIPKQIADLL